jgi:hypothetical protein
VGARSSSVFLLSLICLFLLTLVFPGAAALAVQFSGQVVDGKGLPVDRAVVRLQGTRISVLTDHKGRFEITAEEPAGARHVTAWKQGFYNGGQPLLTARNEVRIVLNPIPQGDHETYEWLPSLKEQRAGAADGKPEVKVCQDCHPGVTEEWQKSTHATSATNPVFLAFFGGTDRRGRKGAGPGYKVDFPNSAGNCSTCHVPAQALKNPFASDPREATGAAREGVFCDLCHKISGARIDRTGGYPGTLSLQFKRPPEDRQVFYGSYDDVFPGDDSYHPLYRESLYCAPCHHGRFWNALIYSEFQEWAESEYAAKKIECQTCHMTPDGVSTRFAPEKEGGVFRAPETIPSHLFSGVSDKALMTEAIDLNAQAEIKEDILSVVVTVKNVKAGHHYPTGNPMRHMILLVDVADEDGRHLSLMQGERVPVWGGVGAAEEGNYAGLPGKGFAKVLRDSVPYPDGRGQRHFQPEYPAPHWRPTVIESDNRIPANGTDISTYQYRVPRDLHGSIHIRSRLIYRKAYKKWMDAKGFDMNEMEIGQKNLTIGR